MGIQKSPEKVEAVPDILRISLVFLEIYTKYRNNHLSQICKLLLNKVPFQWNSECEKAPLRIKDATTSDVVLVRVILAKIKRNLRNLSQDHSSNS